MDFHLSSEFLVIIFLDDVNVDSCVRLSLYYDKHSYGITKNGDGQPFSSQFLNINFDVTFIIIANINTNIKASLEIVVGGTGLIKL